MTETEGAQTARPALSVVATLYRSEAYIAEFCARSAAAARTLVGENYEIVLVNDGSPDKSLEVAVKLAAGDPHVVVVDLSRNFGHHKAMMTGMMQARGDRVFLIDSDLEEDPAWMVLFAAEMDRVQCDVVYGTQQHRIGSTFERWSGALYYKIMDLLASERLPSNVVVARLMSRRYIDALVQHDELEVFMLGLWHITGFEQRSLPVVKLNTSPTTYTFRRKIAMAVSSVTSFSNAPLFAIFYIGALISLIAGLYLIFLLVAWAVQLRPPEGWTSLIASVWFLGGLTISFIGIIGIYLATIFSETKRRPYTIVRAIHGRDREETRP
jgi:putative glycosyltransferase